MAEQTLSELVMNLINWIESLHEKNLKYEAQVENLSRDLAEAQNSNEELKARLSAYHNDSSDNKSTITTTTQASLNHQQQEHITTNIHQQQAQPHPQQPIYHHQPIPNHQSFVSQPSPYVWTYEPSGLEMQVPYIQTYEHYGTPAFHQP